MRFYLKKKNYPLKHLSSVHIIFKVTFSTEIISTSSVEWTSLAAKLDYISFLFISWLVS